MEIITPRAIQQTGNGILVDLGKVWFGQASINVAPENANNRISVTLRESSQPVPLPSTGPEPIGVRFHRVDMLLVEGENQVPLTAKDRRLVPATIGSVMPFRYVEITGWKGIFSASAISIRAAVAKAYRDQGSIYFWGDERARWLNAIWQLAAHTMAATSFAGIFVDGDRERLPYEADAYINQLGWFATAGELSVPRRTFEYLLDKPNWPTEWQSHMIFMAWADYIYSGDTSFLRQHYDRLKFLTLHQLVSDRGLVTTKKMTPEIYKISRLTYPMVDIVDWPQNQRDGHEMKEENTATNAVAYKAFITMAAIAATLGETTDQRFFDQHASKLRDGLERWAALESGLFSDGVGSRHVSAHSIFLPLAFDLVDKKKKPVFIQALRHKLRQYDGGFPGSVYTAQYLLEALFKIGEDDLALELIINPSLRGWRHMIEEYDATITHESWDVSFKDNEDWTHAWGAAPANILPRFLIGIEPLIPGWSRWRLAPSRSLQFSVQASIPMPQGMARVRLDRTQRLASVTVPQGTTCEFSDHRGTRHLTAGQHVFEWHPRQ